MEMYFLLYLLVGLMFYAIVFSIELYDFIKHERRFSSFSWKAVAHGFVVITIFWPWAVPFYVYEKIRYK